ncbi:MAG: MarC family protein [Bdellovibrionales bacterium]|nr:MarC family protein [Bdellovibrionales bacterium]
MDLTSHLSLFALGVSSLMPLVNPIGTALIVNSYFTGLTLADRKSYAFTIALSGTALGLATLLLGSWCLKAMGISIPTTQMGGGLIIAHMGLSLLNSKGQDSPSFSHENVRSSLFYPIAFPLTVGPGGISALITLSAHSHAPDITDTFINMAVLSLSLVATMVITYFCFAYSDVVIRRIGNSGSMVLNRLMAFLVFCIGIQMFVAGLSHSFPKLFGP